MFSLLAVAALAQQVLSAPTAPEAPQLEKRGRFNPAQRSSASLYLIIKQFCILATVIRITFTDHSQILATALPRVPSVALTYDLLSPLLQYRRKSSTSKYVSKRTGLLFSSALLILS